MHIITQLQEIHELKMNMFALAYVINDLRFRTIYFEIPF